MVEKFGYRRCKVIILQRVSLLFTTSCWLIIILIKHLITSILRKIKFIQRIY